VVVEAMPPYNEQIAQLDRQIGSVPPRQNMKDASGASQMDAQTQVTSLYNVAMLEAAQHPIESNVALALLHEIGGVNDEALINVAIGAGINLRGTPELAAADAARAAGNAPNTVLCAAAAIIGPGRAEGARVAARLLIDHFAAAKLTNALDESFDLAKVTNDASICSTLVADKPDASAEAMLAGVDARHAKSVFVRFVRSLDG